MTEKSSWICPSSANSGRAEGGTRSGRTRKKPKDLSACESEEGGRGEGRDVFDTLMESDAVESSISTSRLNHHVSQITPGVSV